MWPKTVSLPEIGFTRLDLALERRRWSLRSGSGIYIDRKSRRAPPSAKRRSGSGQLTSCCLFSV